MTSPPPTDGWQRELEELEARRRTAASMGDAQRVERQHARGHWTARERIGHLVDCGSFREIGTLAGEGSDSADGERNVAPSTYLVGVGCIDGRPAVIGAQDFSRRGGTGDAAAHAKRRYAEFAAADLLVPLVRLVEGGGGSVRSALDIGRTYVPGDAFWKTAIDNLGKVPVVSACLGVAAGIDAALVATSHLALMTRRDACLFAAGPPLVKAAFGTELSKEELGGASVHSGSGVIDVIADDEADALNAIKRFLAYLPSNVYQLPPIATAMDPPEGSEDFLDGVIPRNQRLPYDARALIAAIFDLDSLFELGPRFGRSAITALARLQGSPVGVIAFDPNCMAGSLTSQAADKVVRFLDLCQTFHVPVVRIIDQPGVAIGPAEEAAGAIRHAARLIAAVYQSDVPSIAVIVRRCYGIAGGALNRMTGMHLRYAWPSARWGSLPSEGGVRAAFRGEIESSDDPVATEAAIRRQVDAVASPFRTAEAFGVEEIIAPRETRAALVDWIQLARTKQEARPPTEPLFGPRP